MDVVRNPHNRLHLPLTKITFSSVKHSFENVVSADSPSALHAAAGKVLSRINDIVVGRSEPVKLAFCCLLSSGHLLIEDVPGVGKTTLAHSLARALGLEFTRIQFTSDLLPADVVGVSIYDSESARFRFHQGPVFTQLLLADEINRATPKAQSALLEAMEEGQVTADGESFPLPSPFFVIATQNPQHQIGTFPLPESQLDRFLMRIDVGYPDAQAERLLLTGQDRRRLLRTAEAAIDPQKLVRMQGHCAQLHCSDALIDYVQAILAASRSAAFLRCGLSPRAGIALTRAARSWAFLAGRDLVLPEDVQAVAPSVLYHRLQAEQSGHSRPHELVHQLIQSVPIP